MATRQKLPTATPEQFDGAVLMRVTESNLKVVRYVDISIDRTVTLLGGDNGNGKTTIIDGIDWVLGRKDVIQMDPIRHGKQVGSATLHFGDGETVTLKITKTLKRVGDKDFASEVDIEIPGHVVPSRVQDFLEALKGRQSLDPMWFDKLEGVKQLLALRDLVEFNFDGNKTDYDRLFKLRTAVNSDRDREQAAASSIEILKEAPAEWVDEEALTAELKSVSDYNVDIERRRSNRATAADRITTLRRDARAKLDQIEPDITAETERCQTFIAYAYDQISEWEAEISDLQKKISDKQAKIVARGQERDTEHGRITRDLRAEAKSLCDQADALEAAVPTTPLPDEKDAGAIEAKLNAGRVSNRLLNDWTAQKARREAHQREANEYAKQADDLTAHLTELQRAKQDAILKANLPIDGLGFGDDHVTLHGAPWPQASEAQRIDASMAIAMAHKPKLRTILIRHASGVGSKIRERIRERAHERGYRVIMEIYDETGANSHIYVEDGLVKKIDGEEIPPQEPEPPVPSPRASGVVMEQEPALSSVTQPATASANEAQESPRPKSRKPWQGPGAPKDGAA